MSLKSIYELPPLDLSGRCSRDGFNFQDHVGVFFCIEMIKNENLKQIWFETHDDITLIWTIGDSEYIEFVQVKSEDSPSRWSVSKITARKNGRNGTSIVEKSLGRYRCKEKVKFRIVTKIDVTIDLDILKYDIESEERNDACEAEEKIINSLKKSLGNIKSPGGEDLNYWVKNCYWDKKPDSTESLSFSNKILLEAVLKETGRSLFPDQRDELYQKLLALVSEASSCDLNIKKEGYKLKRDDIIKWIEETIYKLQNPTIGTEGLENKMKIANILDDVIESAKNLRFKYLDERLNSDYIKPSDLSMLEAEIAAIMHIEKVKLDAGDIKFDGTQFHTHCLNRISNKLNDSIFIGKNMPISIGNGYMYELTNRCLHRFVRVEP